MKKTIRAVSVLLVALSLCFVFVGCDMIDDLREKQAIISQDKNAVIYQGQTFLRLPDDIPYFFNNTSSNRINITDYDVPVLLSEYVRYTGYYDPLVDIIAVANINNSQSDYSVVEGFIFPYPNEVYTSEGCTFYTRKENFEKYASLKTEDADRIGFDDYNSDYGTSLYSSSASDEIFNLIKDTKSWSKEEINNFTANIYPLYTCNKELTLRGILDGYEIYIVNGRDAYLFNYITGENVKLSDKTAEEIIDKLP